MTTRPSPTVSPQEPLQKAVQQMTEHETAHLVVVSPDTGRPVGMLSTLDVARAVDAASVPSARRLAS